MIQSKDKLTNPDIFSLRHLNNNTATHFFYKSIEIEGRLPYNMFLTQTFKLSFKP